MFKYVPHTSGEILDRLDSYTLSSYIAYLPITALTLTLLILTLTLPLPLHKSAECTSYFSEFL